ncbi:MAG TPA: hypothetical protein VF868_16125 [Bacteroidia bacterium]
MKSPKTIYAEKAYCSRRKFIHRMRKEKINYLLDYNNGRFGFFRQNLFIASNDVELLNKMAKEVERSNICMFTLCYVEQLKPLRN